MFITVAFYLYFQINFVSPIYILKIMHWIIRSVKWWKF